MVESALLHITAKPNRVTSFCLFLIKVKEMRYALSLLIAVAAFSAASADDYVNGYVRKDGTYVQPHYRTEPNSTKLDNYSTQGNVNPYTGRPGTIDPYSTNSSNSFDSHSGGNHYGYPSNRAPF